MLSTSSRYWTGRGFFVIRLPTIWKRGSTQKSVFEPKKCRMSPVLRTPLFLPCSNSLFRYSLVTRTWNVPGYPQRNTSVGKIHIIVGREQPRIQLTSRHQESIRDSHSTVQAVWSPLLVELYRQTNTNTRCNFKFGIDCCLTAISNVYSNVDCVMCTTIV